MFLLFLLGLIFLLFLLYPDIASDVQEHRLHLSAFHNVCSKLILQYLLFEFMNSFEVSEH